MQEPVQNPAHTHEEAQGQAKAYAPVSANFQASDHARVKTKSPAPATRTLLFTMMLQDIRNSKVLHLAIVVFIALAAVLVSLAAGLTARLAGSIDRMMETAKTPHFLQMHKGELHRKELEQFAAAHPEIETYLIQEFVNLDNAMLKLGDRSLADSVQDNGFVVQPEEQDFLLDPDNQVILPSPGEVYVPLFYANGDDSLLGQSMQIGTQKLRIAGFLRDSQMHSSLASSKRFLVHPSDMDWIREIGIMEYLIEYRLEDKADLQAFSSAYIAADLDHNGPTLTYPLFRVINAINDGFMIALLLFISGIQVGVAFLCIRFTLLAKLEEDMREISVMKICGLPLRFIGRLYSKKYVYLAALGIAVGWLLALLLSDRLSQSMQYFLGAADYSYSLYLLPLAACFILFLMIRLYLSLLLRRLRSIPAVQGLRFGTMEKKTKTRKLLPLLRFSSIKTALAGRDLQVGRKTYKNLFLVFLLSLIMILLPAGLLYTMQSPQSIKYTGIGDYDIAVNIPTDGNNREQAESIFKRIQVLEGVQRSNLQLTYIFPVRQKDNWEQVRIDFGNHETFPLYYVEGSAPQNAKQISLSKMQADCLEIRVGETLQVQNGPIQEELTVSGIYSDITNGGKTAKANFTTTRTDCVWAIVQIQVADSTADGGEHQAMVQERIDTLQKSFPQTGVYSVEHRSKQMMGDVTSGLAKLSLLILTAGSLLAFFITLLSIRMFVLKDRGQNALMKLLGYSSRTIRAIYRRKVTILFALALLAALAIILPVGNLLSSALVSGFGIAHIQYLPDFTAFLLLPALLGGLAYLANYLATADLSRQSIIDQYKE